MVAAVESFVAIPEEAAHLFAIVVVLVLGVTARVLSDRFRIPSVLFLIVAGVGIGPEGLGIVSLETFGTDWLPTIVGIAVAIILFEGSFKLHLNRLREVPQDIARLVTVGALIMWLGTGATVHFFLDTGWDVGLLIGALLIATGPTVITPILNVVTVRDHVAAALESEGIINDVTAAILAVVIFATQIEGHHSIPYAVGLFVFHLTVGVLAGGLVAGAVWLLLTRIDLAPGNAPLHSRLIALGAVTTAFTGAEVIAPESGIAAAATLGFLLGNVELPHSHDIETFMEDLMTIVLSFVFVAIAALIDFADILALGVSGLLVVIAVVLIVRPLLVLLSVWNERFTDGELLFMSFVAPRGIIPASVATLIAIELEAVGDSETAQALAGTVFLIIFVTVVFQGGFARQIAEYLDVTPMRTIIVGGGRVGRALAERLEQDGEHVVIVEPDGEAADKARELGFRVVRGDGGDADVLRKAGAGEAKAVIATTADDDVNLLVCQLARTEFDVERVAARVNQPDNVESFEAVGVSAIDSGLATAYSLENVLERPALSAWMNELGRTGDVQEIDVTAKDLVGKSIAEINAQIPDGCIVGLVTQNSESHVPTGDYVLQNGDHVTFIGQREAVDRAIKRFHPHD